jgi:hypothetical protein
MGAFLLPSLWPFTVAIGLLLALAVLEAASLVVGVSMSHWLDMAVDHPDHPDHPDGPVNAALGWLHIGKVPLLALLVIFLTAFAILGIAGQFLAKAVLGGFLPTPIVVPIAAVLGILAVRVFGRALGRLVPRDESTAISDTSLVGRIGTVVIGTASAGRPAEARLTDEHGNSHYVMVEPDGPDETLEAGASVLLVRHLSGRRFHAIRNPKPGLL